MDALAGDPVGLGHLGDRVDVPGDSENGVTTLFHLGELHKH
jgi:hypothetical protein